MNAPYVDFNTHDYVLLNGNIENRDILITMMYFRLQCPYGTYIWDKKFGNKLQLVVGNTGVTNKKTMENCNYSALSDMVSGGYITNLSVICTYYDFKKASFDIRAASAQGQPISFNWSLPI